MKYKTLNGTILESDHTQTVVHVEEIEDHPEGIFQSLETTSAANQFGIQQIKITRTVVGTQITYQITHSTDAELEAYLSSITQTL